MALRILARVAGVVALACVALAGPAVAQGTIKIAYTDPLSGPFAQVGDANLKQMQYILDHAPQARRAYISRTGAVGNRERRGLRRPCAALEW